MPEYREKSGNVCLGMLPVCWAALPTSSRDSVGPSTGRPSTQEIHSWLTPHLQNSLNSACVTIQKEQRPPTSSALARFFQSARCPVSQRALTRAPGITGQTLPCFCRCRSRGGAVLRLVWGRAKFRGLTSKGFSYWNTLCCKGRLPQLSTIMLIIA